MGDVTERKLAEQARRTAEERHRALFLGNPLPMWIYDVESFKFLAVNDAACESYGYSRDEFQAMTILSLCAEEDQTLVSHAIEQDKTIALTHRIWRHRKKDGSIIRVELTSHYLEWEGRPARCACPIDITERLRADEAIKEANRSLERAQEALRQSNAELEAFSYSVSHDLQAPLRTINGYSQILLEDYADQLDEGATKTLGRITRAAAKMSLMIEKLLALARVSRIQIQPTDIDLTTMTKGIASELQAGEATRQVEWRVQEGIAAKGDLRLVRTALENLLSNAWKFTSQRDNAVIEVGSARNAEGETVLHVKDNGAGFDMAYAGKLFGVFQRLHSEAEFEGIGIGLATVRRIVQRHGGRIWAESNVGEGTTFYFTLPDAI